MLTFLLRPFAYWKIDHGEKRHVDWTIPLFFALLTTLAVEAAGWRGQVDIYGTSGLINRVLGFVQNLPGFYIAALAAIATFNKTDIDRYMPEPAPMLDVQIQGRTVAIKLTRRRFLCSMFAFLTAQCILLTILAVGGLAVAEPVKALLAPPFHVLARYSFLFLYGMLFWQMVVVTFWGLYYLGEKLHEGAQTP